jgi:hypothetical protein
MPAATKYEPLPSEEQDSQVQLKHGPKQPFTVRRRIFLASILLFLLFGIYKLAFPGTLTSADPKDTDTKPGESAEMYTGKYSVG